MIRAHGQRLSLRELGLPLFFSFLGAAIVLASVPGQGKTGFMALGMSLSFVGVAIARNRIRRKGSN